MIGIEEVVGWWVEGGEVVVDVEIVNLSVVNNEEEVISGLVEELDGLEGVISVIGIEVENVDGVVEEVEVVVVDGPGLSPKT